MITILFVLVLLGMLFAVVCMGAVILIDPIIAIVILYGVYRIIKHFTSKK